MKTFFRDNGLSITMFGLFFFSLVGQIISGHAQYNEEQQEHNQPQVALGEYLGTGHFFEAVFENWESEFLQMSAYVILTVFLFQKGSSESKDPLKEESVDKDPREPESEADKRQKEVDKLRIQEKEKERLAKAKSEEEKNRIREESKRAQQEVDRQDEMKPEVVKKGMSVAGVALKLYENSLSIVLGLLFIFSFMGHAVGGTANYNEEQLAHGGEVLDVLQYVITSRFWFESFQNWQSEFLSVGSIIVLSIFLRQKGSPESKPVASPHSQTGTE